jgi:N-acetylglucosaminyldiphosphoundecaprenol N-acetyl-beta-D-mannosaminyltransferase
VVVHWLPSGMKYTGVQTEMMRKVVQTSLTSHPRCNILGVGVSAINMDAAVSIADKHIEQGGKGFVCVTGVHGVMEAQSDRRLLDILNRSLMTTPDGMPTVWVGRYQGHRGMSRVYGPDFMMEFCARSVARGYRHFLYGGNEGVAERLAKVLQERFPGLDIAGTYTPPFRPLTPVEQKDLVEVVRQASPHVIWVGLSTPKQERFMAEYIGRLDTHLMVGVGAAFDIHTGGIADAPDWMKRSGLQWLHRLCQEPRRLGKRYLINNPRFVWKIGLQALRIRRYKVDPQTPIVTTL